MNNIQHKSNTVHQKMTDDPLQLIITFLKDVPNNIMMKIMVIFSMCFIQLFEIIGLFIIFSKEDKIDPPRYFTTFFLPQTVLCISYAVLGNSARFNAAQQMTFHYSLPIDALGTETEKHILQFCNRVKLLCILSVAIHFLLIIAINLDYSSGFNQPDRFLVALTIETYFNKSSIFLKSVHIVSHLFIIYNVIIILLYILYCVSHLKIQMLLLKTYLAKLCLDVVDFGLIHDKGYQKAVRIKLRESVIRHINIKRLAKRNFNVQSVAVTVIYLTFVVTLFLVANVYILRMRVSSGTDWRISFIVFVGILVLLLISWHGQIIKNEGETLFVCVTQCPWIIWDTNNRKTFHLLLTNCLVPPEFSAYNLIQVDATMLIKIYNTGYKVLLFFNYLNSPTVKW